jgi:hypothetical protein
MSRPEVERARAFLDRADANLAAVRALETVDTVPDEIAGFHAQQAAEKLPVTFRGGAWHNNNHHSFGYRPTGAGEGARLSHLRYG